MKNHYFNLIRTVWCYGVSWGYHILGYYLVLGIAQTCLSLSLYAFRKAIDQLQNFKFGGLSKIIFWAACWYCCSAVILVISWPRKNS